MGILLILVRGRGSDVYPNHAGRKTDRRILPSSGCPARELAAIGGEPSSRQADDERLNARNELFESSDRR
jgi:hypothetical protein